MNALPLCAALSLVTACGAPPVPAVCVTRCGLRLTGEPPPGWTCEALQAVEDGVVAAFPQALDPRLSRVCAALSGWELTVMRTPTWVEPRRGVEVDGLTNCSSGTTAVGAAPPTQSSLPHELAHVAQDCRATCEVDGDDGHGCWKEDRIFIAAGAANLAAWRTLSR